MRKTKLVAAVVVTAGLLLGVSGTAMAVGHDSKPAQAPATATAEPTPATKHRATQAPTAAPEPSTTARTGRTRPSATKAPSQAPAPTARPKRSATTQPRPTAATGPRDQVTKARPARPVATDPNFTG